jgi:hypothetical protein
MPDDGIIGAMFPGERKLQGVPLIIVVFLAVRILKGGSAMKKLFALAIIGLLWNPLTIIATTEAAPVSNDDLWDISEGATVTNDSGVHTTAKCPIENMFGGDSIDWTGNPCYATLFKDYEPIGYVHWVEWMTPTEMTLRSFNLVAAHDWGEDPHGDWRDINYRGFSEFRLYARDGSGNWSLLYQYFTDPDGDLDYGGGDTYPREDYLELNDNVAPTRAQYFRAEFVQYGSGSSWYGDSQGPRVIELDGYSVSTSGWGAAYDSLFEDPFDLALLRDYRDEFLSKTRQGKLYKELLYQSSEEALEILLDNPQLFYQVRGLIETNKDAVEEILDGKKGVIYSTNKIVSFLEDYADVSPPALKALANMVKREIVKKQKRGQVFLGFELR